MALRQLSEQDKQAVLNKQGLRCFINNHPIDSEAEVEFDHIRPYADDGPTNVDNISVVCRKHNREKGSMSLSEFRDRLALRAFFDGGKKRRLDDLLLDRRGRSGFGQAVPVESNGDQLTLHLDSGSRNVRLETCPATGERFFYAVLPVSVLKNDGELQPRTLDPERLWELYRHLLNHSQLAPAVCRLVGKDLLLFDGQHKAAAQVWAGRDRIDCKVYVEPDARRIKETNLQAHDKLKQMPFYTSTLIDKYSALAREDWHAFLESAKPKTEVHFAEFMMTRVGLSRAEALKRIRAMIHDNILEHPNNRLRPLIAEENRAPNLPLTLYRVEKTFFAEFIAAAPLNDEFESDADHRDEERENMVRLFNLVFERALDGRWAPDRNDDAHKKAERLFSGGALRAWVGLLRGAITPALRLFDDADKYRPFYRELGDADFEVIERLLDRLLSHQVWIDPNPDLNDLRYDNATRGREILKKAGLTASWIYGGEG